MTILLQGLLICSDTVSANQFNDDKAIIVEVTAYSNHFNSTGKYPNDPTYGITTSGKKTYWGAVAAGPKIPLGTKMYIEGFGNKVFTAEDRGGGVRGYGIDIWFEQEADCWKFGRKKLKIWIIK